jgi:LmbE family N-acetylglucosaminyl deacetylase
VHASVTAQAAVAETGIPAKLYLSAMRGSDWQKLRDTLREAGIEMPEMEITDEMRRQMAETEQRITTTVDIRPVLSRKRDALVAHASQIQESWFSQIPPGIAETVFGREHFIRAKDSTGAPTPEDDLFAGLRSKP